MDTVTVTEHVEPVFIFKAQEYRLEALKAQLPRAPLVEISTADLNPPGVGEGPFQVQFFSGAMDGAGEEVTFFRQEGKFTVLLGQSYVQAPLKDGTRHVRGRIISSPALKRARIGSPFIEGSAQALQEPVREPVAVQTPANRRNTGLARTEPRRWHTNPRPRNGAGARGQSATSRYRKGG
ncbi:hypothetical protein HDG34_003245 [Paraburkholderia sp. HC6.4b]|uniref:hypothetical protein n=1 Tax=unclassified Paraburkholderia TaxID=2615204 RepID=UPI00161D65CD|nr:MULTISPECIES: hypothetical protein [unclassified Paraburkholderia]MBB5409304.1 hypothetical protein [Paraburkholderia sp. HC6.4b]MBB5451032.1 hypothetical protein [Paraburkholderia sp. Kb1A]